MGDAFQSGANIEIVVNPFEGQPPVAGRYELFTEVGSGQLGRVYVANDLKNPGRRVAVKVLNPRMSTDFDDPAGTQRFIRSAREAARLDHRGIVPVFAIDQLAGDGPKRVALVQEYVTWPTLAAVLKKHGSLSADATTRLLRAVADAVEAAHDQDVLHLDLRPGNIFVSAKGSVRVSDFAVRGALQGEVTPDNPQQGAFLAPEQRTGGAVSRATDVYAMGLLLQHLLTGEPPDASSSTPLPNGLDLVVERATRKNPADRLPGMEAFRHAMDAPAAYRTPVPSGVFVQSNLASPEPLDFYTDRAVPLLLWLAAGVGLFVLTMVCAGGVILLALQGG